ncbi:MAG: type II toxin-antitoxin system VapC family toxin [Thermodesulfobacteriota bacterium]
MGIILDTSLLIAAERGEWEVRTYVKGREEEPFGLSVISVSELLQGVHRADSEKRRLKRSAYVEKVIELFPIYPFDLAASRIYAEVWANLLGKGIQVGAHDLIIAATALSRGFSVASMDKRHFDKIEGLEFEWVRKREV